MRSVMKKCGACGRYPLNDVCPACGHAAGNPMPPRYSPEDRYGAYRRKLKRAYELERLDTIDNIVIRYLDHPKLEDPIFIEGLPGIGNVGKLAAEHLKDELKGVKFAEIFSKYFPPQVLVQDDGQVKLVNNEMHYVKPNNRTDLILLTGDYQGLTPEGQYELSDFILKELKGLGVRRIFTLGGDGEGRLVTEPRVPRGATGLARAKERGKCG